MEHNLENIKEISTCHSLLHYKCDFESVYLNLGLTFNFINNKLELQLMSSLLIA